MNADTFEDLDDKSLYILLDEVTVLKAQIESESPPYAHYASRQAALATHALETHLVHATKLSSNLLSLKILRAIATTTTIRTDIKDITSDDVGLAWLMLETGVITPHMLFQHALGEFTQIIRLLLERGEIMTINAQDFQTACERGHPEIVRQLLELPLERGVDMAACNNGGFLAACVRGHTEIVRLLLDLPSKRGVNPSVNGNYALRIACGRGHPEIVRLLLDLPLERVVNPATCDNWALRGACERGHTEIVRCFLICR